MMPVIERARKYIAKCPVAVSGQGGHDATFHAAAILVHAFALGETDSLGLLRDWNRSCVPPWNESDLIYKIKSAANATHQKPRGWLAGGESPIVNGQSPRGKDFGGSPVLPRERKPEFSSEMLRRVAGKTSDIGDVVQFISERSPVVAESQDSASVLRRLYPRGSGEKVLIFSEMKSQGQFLWEADKSDVIQNRHLPTGKEGVWFLPQPVCGEYFPNPRMEGKMSRRSEESVMACRYAVLESDEADADDWLRCLVQLPLRMACICESGGRSIHALVRMDATSKADWDERVGAIKPILITLGADRGALSAVRLSRLPQAMRGERVQRLLYLDPQSGGVPILRRKPRELSYGGQRDE